jgi:glucose-6-phosphate 1-dehydrogenase
MAKLVPVETFDLIIFGGTGDLAMRKLLPALYHRDCDDQITNDSRIIAVSRSAMARQAAQLET